MYKYNKPNAQWLDCSHHQWAHMLVALEPHEGIVFDNDAEFHACWRGVQWLKHHHNQPNREHYYPNLHLRGFERMKKTRLIYRHK